MIWHKITDRNWGFVSSIRPHHFFWAACILLSLWLILAMLGCKEESSSDSPSQNSWSQYPARPWTMTTPAGMNIVTDMSTIEQYNALWSGDFEWEDIDWNTLDEEFARYKQYYCNILNWDCKDVTPSHLTVYIKSWDGGCNDSETPSQPREVYAYIDGSWMCVDGWYWGRVIYFHLGDDPGVDHTTILSEDGLTSIDYEAFQETAYSHELLHFFQDMSGLPYDETTPLPPVISGYTIILPHEEEDEEDQRGE